MGNPVLTQCPVACPPCGGGDPCAGVVCAGEDPSFSPTTDAHVVAHSSLPIPPALPPVSGSVHLTGSALIPAISPAVPVGCDRCAAGSGTYTSGGMSVSWTVGCGSGGATTIGFDATATAADVFPFISGPDASRCCCGWPTCDAWVLTVHASYGWEDDGLGGWNATLRVRAAVVCNSD